MLGIDVVSGNLRVSFWATSADPAATVPATVRCQRWGASATVRRPPPPPPVCRGCSHGVALPCLGVGPLQNQPLQDPLLHVLGCRRSRLSHPLPRRTLCRFAPPPPPRPAARSTACLPPYTPTAPPAPTPAATASAGPAPPATPAPAAQARCPSPAPQVGGLHRPMHSD